MFLTRMYLNPTRLTTRRMLTSPQVTHALVMGAIPPGAGSRRVLWRIDRRNDHKVELYVTSTSEPDLTGIVEQAGWPTRAAWQTADYSRFLGRLAPGQRWMFRLTANPTRAVASERGRRGRVTPCRTVGQQTDWLLSRANRAGFKIPSTELDALQIELRERSTASFDRRSGDSHRERRDRVSLTRATYEGMLEVQDPEKLRESLTEGIGRAKGYGCGLMTLAPVR